MDTLGEEHNKQDKGSAPRGPPPWCTRAIARRAVKHRYTGSII